jgi:hypothetical protein
MAGPLGEFAKGTGVLTQACFVKYVHPAKAPQVDGEYKKAVDKAFQEFLTKPFVVPAPDAEVSAIQHWTMITGEHGLHFRVTPTQLNKDGKWSLSYKTYIVRTNGQKEVVFQGAMNGNKQGAPVEKLVTTFPIVATN